jgi:hypothetical protein
LQVKPDQDVFWGGIMNLITFGFSEKGTPVFLNQEPYPQVGTLYLMKAGENSVIGITLDDKNYKTR